MSEQSVERARTLTLSWLEEAVIGLNFCPFAAAPYRRGEVEVRICESTDPEQILQEALEVLEGILEPQGPLKGTTLLVLSQGLSDFEEYLDVVDALGELMEEVGADALVQVASFHPEYRFEGEDPEDVSHYTNRSPYPILHFLLEESVTEAIAAHTDVESIPATNIARLRELGPEGVSALWERWR